ncbi:UDP-N-acetylmuramoyl-tripeptide--D-alanyl-D-alanine ligase [Alkalibacterium subtropicum]|uniref:UDP-N-acetylmuramoyl-tripeptide--D-alanyl-D-alanine ligase n=1 Tax=Alkalibacterium subtropicum TaxID=753702 RepID=A0A1I1LC38_9LACT|nr:UDP-N-acetylmuramoyl-tripeptide--D-alanyl-D-alanine ligase [Alkalibacterium subtropicum]SFC70654.1 UDP-N-acetylmuramoyl-tripeptide--D-alanyl-D-alanine ligase [Alkalibacterium subtropicum]
MPNWTLNEIAQAVGGKVFNSEKTDQVTGVSFDTRTLTEGDLFIPLTADRNGHDFIQSAMDKGASATLWSDPIEHAPKEIAVIQVEDTLKAFQSFAKDYLNEVSPKVVGITGSNGKTTTKDMVAAVASAKYKTHKTSGNFNNHLGLPLTILDMDRDTEVIVLEMGMSEKGEIHVLSEIAEPDIAVITMIGESHIEFLGSREAISEAKLEIVEGMKQGTLIYPGEEPLLETRIADGWVDEKVKTVKTFGKQTGVDLYSTEIETEMKQTRFKTNQEPDVACTLPIPGEYNVQNALAAILVGETLGIEREAIYEQLSNFQLTKNRLEWQDGVNGSVLLNDAYNASPSSVRAVLRYFKGIDVPGRKIVVLGDILELGDQADTMHRELHEAIDPDSIDELVLYGEFMKALYEKMSGKMEKSKLHHFAGDKDKVVAYLKDTLQPEDTVLFKSSFSTGMLEVVSKLSQDEKQ